MRTNEFFDDRRLCLVELWEKYRAKGWRVTGTITCICAKCETARKADAQQQSDQSPEGR